MARFPVGQRVRKVRGDVNVGVEGVVVNGEISPLNQLTGSDFLVSPFTPCIDERSGSLVPARTVGAAASKDWEPILPEGHKAGDYGFTELMDSLREGVSA